MGVIAHQKKGKKINEHGNIEIGCVCVVSWENNHGEFGDQRRHGHQMRLLVGKWSGCRTDKTLTKRPSIRTQSTWTCRSHQWEHVRPKMGQKDARESLEVRSLGGIFRRHHGMSRHCIGASWRLKRISSENIYRGKLSSLPT